MSGRISEQGLTHKQEAFCIEYVKDGNGTQAAIRAGYSPNSADVTGSRLLSHPKVSAKIQSMMSKKEEEVIVSRDQVLRQYKRLAFFDIRKFYDSNGNLKPIVELDDDTAAAISGFEVEEKSTVDVVGDEEEDLVGLDKPVINTRFIPKISAVKKIKLSDMKGALDSICKMEGFNTPDKVLMAGKVETIVSFKRG